jgi:predicted PurR-regulated permease PerM
VLLAEPAAKWIDEIPRALPSIKSKLRPVSKPIQKIGEAASEVENLTQIDTRRRQETGMLEAMIEATPELLVSLGVVPFLFLGTITLINVRQRLVLSPRVVYVAVVFWSYLRGLVGAIVAVPIVASIKIILHHVPEFRLVAKLIAR